MFLNKLVDFAGTNVIRSLQKTLACGCAKCAERKTVI